VLIIVVIFQPVPFAFHHCFYATSHDYNNIVIFLRAKAAVLALQNRDAVVEKKRTKIATVGMPFSYLRASHLCVTLLALLGNRFPSSAFRAEIFTTVLRFLQSCIVLKSSSCSGAQLRVKIAKRAGDFSCPSFFFAILLTSTVPNPHTCN